MVEFVANIVMFVPIGIFFVLLFGRARWWLAIALGVLLSMGIETIQHYFLPTRVADVRDVLANASGTAIGVILVAFFTWLKACQRGGEPERDEPFARDD